MSRLVFLDTETTGLSLDDDIWEFAAIVRDPGQPDVEIHDFIDHDAEKARGLPKPFFDDYWFRYNPDLSIPRQRLVALLLDIFAGKAHVVGAVPNFDTERLAILLAREGHRPPWHYHLIDVENLAVGYLAAKGFAVALPWNSDDLSAALGVTAPEEARHTALGDARWARDIYDAVTGGQQAALGEVQP